MIIACMGMQWGDEGKGKIVDVLAEEADYVVKYHGGPNAGSHVRVDGKDFSLHHIPVGILRGKNVVLANGMVIDPDRLEKEVIELEEAGLSVRDKIFISDQAHVIQDSHREADADEEKLGTTRRGIGFCYSDKMLRTGLRIGDLDNFFLKDRVCNTVHLLNGLANEGRNILLQGSQGVLLDIDHGTYPFVTSSSVGVGGIFTGTGLSPRKVDRVLGVAKAYQTRVGTGPFPTECDEAVELFQEKGNEVGVTTGRKRRCGWLDLVALKHACVINGLDGLAVTKMDILCEVPKLKVCVAYEIDGKSVLYPSSSEEMERVEPVYEEMEGWGPFVENYGTEATAYFRNMSDFVNVPLTFVSFGPDREDLTRLVPQRFIWESARRSGL